MQRLCIVCKEKMRKEMKFGTLCVHAGEKPDSLYGTHTTPI